MVHSTVSAPELTAEQVQRILVQPLADKSVFLAAGPRIFDSSSEVRIPKLGGPITDPGWTGENEQIPERDADFDEITLLPSTMKSVKVLTRYSNELARQSIVSLDATLRDRLVTDVANKLDAQFLGDAGDGLTTPRGLFAYEDVQALEVDAPLDLDVLLTAWGMALSANVNMAALKWVLTPREFVALRKVKDTSGKYLLESDLTKDATYRIFGIPVTVTNKIPTGKAILADTSQIAVVRDVNPSITVLSERYAEFDQIGLRVVCRYDLGLLNSEGVVVLSAAGGGA